MYKSILVPVDIMEDELTRKALEYAVHLAKQSDAKIRLLHVFPMSTSIINSYELGYMELQDKAAVKAKKKLEEISSTIDLPKDRVSYSMSFGSVRDEIVEVTEQIGADLIVIGSKRPNIKTHLLGSNASSIVRYATTSVLIVR
ncbi:universal stress protein [Budviciaceae bacterium CWB-B4]|uniref:Universal stress protein n=1 Tax=Limnobaculum xujianqingii TaxID=2738837 RepID=A0A9D7AI34_9GAMM|nr:universal stress protein [Limnobaculum xujianqingii]MBK5073040.1 universal stress protein [Limnobaculum xujianqingii]MBK5176349.1 universal stress protein [Limnobaculum xujianqingii]